MDVHQLACYFDHTALKSQTAQADIDLLCAQAKEHQFFAVCVNAFWLPRCRELLTQSQVQLCTVVNFPLGASGSKAFLAETEQALKDGATEIDGVLNIGALKSGLLKTAGQELKDLVQATRGRALVKIIVESAILTETELRQAIDLVNDSGAEFIKTSTGFSTGGATPQAVQTMKTYGREGLKIKASGGISTLAEAKTYIALGVHRIGASKSVEILEEHRKSL
jgi:deoxyribose-phosphate aldolase